MVFIVLAMLSDVCDIYDTQTDNTSFLKSDIAPKI
jgi:hypothetical protein